MIAVSELGGQQRLAVRRDLPAVRRILRRIKHTEKLVALNLFDRRKAVQTLDYLERRSINHASVELPIYVMPVDFDGRHTHNMEEAECILAITKDVSLRGIGFTHDEPFEAHYAIVTFDLLDNNAVELLLEVRWSNRKTGLSQMSGGIFLGVVEPSTS